MLADRVAGERAARQVTRSDPVTMEEFGYLLSRGGMATKTRSGLTMGPERALGISAWYSGARYLGETVAGLPFRRFKDSDTEGRVRRAEPAWKTKPDVETPWFSLVEFIVMCLIHRGNSYNYKIRDGVGRVVGLRPIHPDRVKPGQASDGTKVFEVDKTKAFTRREVLHIPGLSYDGVVGMNPLQYQAETLGGVAAAAEYGERFFGQGSLASAYISAPATLTESQANELRDVWEEQHRGLLNAHEIAVLGGGAEYKSINLDPASAQLIETRKLGVTEVCRILRIPPHKLYDLERATFSNIEHQSIEAATDSIQPWCSRIEAHINFDPDLTPPGTFHEFVLEGLLRGDTKNRYEAYAAATGGVPWMAINETRRLENLPPVPGGDVVARPLNTDFGTLDPETTPADPGGTP